MLPELANDSLPVCDRLGILEALRSVMAARQPISLRWNEGTEGVLTALLHADQDPGGLYFDCPVDVRANASLAASGSARLVAQVDGVRIELLVDGIEPALWEGRPALRSPLPERMLRLQRRESFRTSPSLHCQITLQDGEHVRVLEPRVADLSLGGLALTLERTVGEFRTETSLPNCRLPLGRAGAVVVSLEVRNVLETRAANGARQLRLGCRFVDMPTSTEHALARFIGELQRSRRR